MAGPVSCRASLRSERHFVFTHPARTAVVLAAVFVLTGPLPAEATPGQSVSAGGHPPPARQPSARRTPKRARAAERPRTRRAR